MARSSAPPGPPPPHFRPPGTAASTGTTPLGGLTGQPTGGASTPQRNDGLGPGAATAIAIVTLLIGIVVGFFAGRASEPDRSPTAAPPLTSPSTSPTSRPPGDTIPQSPSDPDSPPSTDLDPTTIGTAEDPIPAGQAYVLGLYEIEVLSVERDAASTLAEFNGSTVAPPVGRQHVLVEVSVRFTDSSGVGNPAAIPLFLSDGIGTWNDYDATCGAVPRSILGAGLIEQGDQAVGNACFTVPTEVLDELMLGTEGFSGPVYFALPA